jgi:hypothetical protein
MVNICISIHWLRLISAGGLLILSATGIAADGSEDLARQYIAIQERHSDILAIPGVVGSGVARSKEDPTKLVIRVYVKRGIGDERKRSLPTELEGAPVEVIEEDEFAPQ